MAPPRDEGTETDPAPPTAFATGSVQDRDELRAADLRSAPRPSLLTASVQTLKGAGPKLAAAAADMGLGSVGDLLLHVPHSYRDRAEPRKLAELRIGEEATVEVDVRSARVRPTRRRGLVIVEATVADDSRAGEGGLVQPGLARRPPHRGHAAAPVRQARPLRLSRGGPRGARRGRPRRRNPHDRDRARPSGIRAAARAAASRVGLAGPAARLLCDRAASGRAPRPPRPGVGGGRVDRRPFPGEPRRGGGGAGGASPSRSCSCIRSRSRRAAPSAGRVTRASP